MELNPTAICNRQKSLPVVSREQPGKDRRWARAGLMASFAVLSFLCCGTGMGAATYVSGSLTDTNATNGNGISTPSGATNIQYSNGSSSGTYGGIDFADSQANAEWKYDLGSTTAITSLTFWSYGAQSAYSSMPSGTITIYGSSSSSGPWTQIGQVTRTMVRDTVLPNSQATDGEGFRVPCNGGSYRYVRINCATPGTVGGLDNHWKIRLVEVNKNLVVHDFYRVSDGSSALNDLPRIPYNIVDGSNSTMWNPQSTNMVLTLDLGPAQRRFQQIIFTPNAGDGSYLPQKGEVRVSSTDDPDNMDTVVGLFNVSWNNENTDGVTIILPQPFKKRFVQVHWDSVRNPARTQTRIAEITVDTVEEKPTGTDITQASIPSAYRVTPNDGQDDRAKLQAAIDQYKYVYLPPGTYNLSGTLYMPTKSRLYGASDDTTILQIDNPNSTTIRVEGSDFVMLDHFRIHRPTNYPDSMDEAIFVYRNPANNDVPYYVEIDNVKVTDYRSRAPAISLHYAAVGSVTNCSVYRYQRIFNDPYPNGDPNILYNFIYGSGITAERCDFIYFGNNVVNEERDLRSARTGPMPSNGAFDQSSAIQLSSCYLSVVRKNVIDRTGQGIDCSGSDYCRVEDNDIADCNAVGIKLVNGTTYCLMLNNVISECGLVGIWLSAGSSETATTHNLVDGNIISKTGQGIGAGHWTNPTYGVSGWAPCGIKLEKADTAAGRTQYNTVSNNKFYENSSMHAPASTFAVYSSPKVTTNPPTYEPQNNTVFNNTLIDGPAPQVPGAPALLSATVVGTSVSLSWAAVSGATSYIVERGTTSGGPYTQIASGVTVTNYSDSGLSPGTYFYVVSAVNAQGTGARSNQATASIAAPLPAAPANLTAQAGNGKVTLTWSAVSGATSYNIKVGLNNGGPYVPLTSGVTSTNYVDNTLSNGTTYYYVVEAVNASGIGPQSNQASATPRKPPQPTGAVSRMSHGSAGEFDIPIAVSGVSSGESECRQATTLKLVVTFDKAVVSGQAAVGAGTASISGAPQFSGNTMTIALTGVADAQNLRIDLTNVQAGDGGNLETTSVSVGILTGDANNDGNVNTADMVAIRAKSGANLSNTTLRCDVNRDGNINTADMVLTRGRSGTTIP